MSTLRQTPGRAFTLIELLVVIAIIGLLVAILAPMAGRAKEKGNITYCAANLHNIGQVLNMYADDHDDYLPPVGVEGATDYPTWDSHLRRYLGETDRVLLCPSDTYRESGVASSPRTYAANGGFSEIALQSNFPFGPYNGTNATHRLGTLKTRSGRLILVGERPGGAAEAQTSRGYVGEYSYCGLDERPGDVHEGGQGANYLFADMSVIYYRISDTVLSDETDYWYVQ